MRIGSRLHLELDRAFVLVGQAVGEQGLDPPLVIWPCAGFGNKGRNRPCTARWRRCVSGPSSQSSPSQRRPLRIDVHRLLRVARRVGVLDAQDERAAGVPGVQPVEQRRAGAADVEEAGRTRRKTNTRFHRHQWVGEEPGVRDGAAGFRPARAHARHRAPSCRSCFIPHPSEPRTLRAA